MVDTGVSKGARGLGGFLENKNFLDRVPPTPLAAYPSLLPYAILFCDPGSGPGDMRASSLQPFNKNGI